METQNTLDFIDVSVYGDTVVVNHPDVDTFSCGIAWLEQTAQAIADYEDDIIDERPLADYEDYIYDFWAPKIHEAHAIAQEKIEIYKDLGYKP
jgi:hypothetical protein